MSDCRTCKREISDFNVYCDVICMDKYIDKLEAKLKESEEKNKPNLDKILKDGEMRVDNDEMSRFIDESGLQNEFNLWKDAHDVEFFDRVNRDMEEKSEDE